MSINSVFCGIECVFKNSSDICDFLKLINIDSTNMIFYVIDNSLFYKNDRIELSEELSVNYFSRFNSKQFVVERLVLHLYPTGAVMEKIDNYNEFLLSECEMIVLICDACYLEIYCKNQRWLQTLLSDAKNIRGAVVEKKYTDTDPRTEMYV